MVERRRNFLTAYQNAAYARRYTALVERVRQAEADKAPGRSGLATAAARYYFKLLAYKDEYEVARLYSDPGFLRNLRDQFEGDFKLQVHLAPPLLSAADPDGGPPRKRAYGPWIFSVFRLLSELKVLRGTPFDPFGYGADRRRERQLIRDYEGLVEELLSGLDQDNHGLAVELASLPEQVRGYGHVKEAHLKEAKAREAQLLEAWHHPAPAQSAAE